MLLKYEDYNKEYVQARFKHTYDSKGYSVLRNNGKTLITGVWDDHDYGLNNAGSEYP